MKLEMHSYLRTLAARKMQSSMFYLQLQINLVMYRLHIVSTGIEIFCHFVASEEEEEEEN
jgi:hypothetical protein